MASNRRQLLPFGLDWADLNALPQDKAYEYPLPINGEPTSKELNQINNFFNLVTQMKNSSFYTGNLEALSKDNKRSKGTIEYLEGGVNDGIKRYSDKYRKKIKIGRSISDHPFQTHLFPTELQPVLGQSKSKKKSIAVASYSKSRANGDLEKNIDKFMLEKEQDQKKAIMDRLNDMEANLNAGIDLNDDENENDEEEEEENIDDEFEDDDDDDYNAEKYFDDGDDYGGDDGGDDEAAF